MPTERAHPHVHAMTNTEYRFRLTTASVGVLRALLDREIESHRISVVSRVEERNIDNARELVRTLRKLEALRAQFTERALDEADLARGVEVGGVSSVEIEL